MRGWLPPRPATAHKWTAACCVIAGSAAMPGAGHLAAAAAQRAGAGMVRLGSPGVVDDPARPTEAVGLALPREGWADARARRRPSRPRAGHRTRPRHGGRHASQPCVDVLARADLPVVVDGDGLTALGADAGRVAGGSCRPHRAHPPRRRVRAAGGQPAGRRIGWPRPGRSPATVGAVVAAEGPDHRRRGARRPGAGDRRRRCPPRHRRHRRRAQRHHRRPPRPGRARARGGRRRQHGCTPGPAPPARPTGSWPPT